MVRYCAKGGAAVKVELTPDAAQWVEAEVASGTFATAEDAVRHAISALRVNALRATLDAAVAEGGSHTTADARRYVRERLEKRNSTKATL
jgi:Arc/MetJ-type ribon-helix-helix transcriptional regulator